MDKNSKNLKTGKLFTIKLDPKKVAVVYNTEKSLRKKIEKDLMKDGNFKKEELKDVKYDMQEFHAEWKEQVKILKAEEKAKREVSPNYPESHVTDRKSVV